MHIMCMRALSSYKDSLNVYADNLYQEIRNGNKLYLIIIFFFRSLFSPLCSLTQMQKKNTIFFCDMCVIIYVTSRIYCSPRSSSLCIRSTYFIINKCKTTQRQRRQRLLPFYKENSLVLNVRVLCFGAIHIWMCVRKSNHHNAVHRPVFLYIIYTYCDVCGSC